MSNPNSPLSRNIPSKSCLSSGLVTIAMALFLLGFLFVRLQFS